MTNMKKLYNVLLMALVTMAGFTACSESEDYQPGTVSGVQVFFSNELPSQRNLSFDETTFIVPINRYVTDEAITVNLSHTDNTGFYSIPSTVTFAAGQSEATIEVTYDAENMEYNNFVPDTITIASEEYTTPYAASSYAFSGGAPLTYKSLGTGKYVDDWFPYTGNVEILQCEQQPNRFRIAAPYAGFNGDADFEMTDDVDEYLELTVMQPGTSLGGIEITRNDLVYYSDYSTGANLLQYDDIINLLHPSRFAANNTEASWSYNRVVEFDENGLPARIQLAPYYYMFSVGGFNYSQYDDIIQIYFPGNDPKDYTLDVNYLGKFINIADEYFAAFSLTLGGDVEEVKYALVSSTDADAAIEGIAEGTIDANSVTTSGTYQLPVTETGRYAIVVVAFAGGEAVAYNTASFKFEVGAPEVWNALGIGSYTENVLCEIYGAPAVTFDVEIEESQDRPGVYRLVNAYGEGFPYNDPGDWDDSKAYYIEINAQDPEAVFIEQQSTGLNWGDGEFFIQSLGSYYLDNGEDFDEIKSANLFGTLVDGVITFPAEGILGTLEGTGRWQVNTDGDTKIVLPGAVATEARATSRTAGNSKSGHSQYTPNNSHKFKKNRQVLLSTERAM